MPNNDAGDLLGRPSGSRGTTQQDDRFVSYSCFMTVMSILFGACFVILLGHTAGFSCSSSLVFLFRSSCLVSVTKIIEFFLLYLFDFSECFNGSMFQHVSNSSY